MSDHVSEVETAVNPIEQAYQALQEQFPGKVTADGREGYEGVIVDADTLVELAE